MAYERRKIKQIYKEYNIMNIKDNKMIAEFMGMTYGDPNDNSVMTQGSEVIPIESMEFHSSWDWLMPIVDIIRESGYRIELSHGGLVGRILETTNDSSDVVARVSSKAYGVAYEFDNPKEALYNLVVRFIKWSNESFRSN